MRGRGGRFLLVRRMTRGVSLLLVSLGALLLGLCSGAQLRSELRSELLGLKSGGSRTYPAPAPAPAPAPVAASYDNTVCGKYAGNNNADGTPYGFAWYKVMVCSTNSALVILQPPTTNTYWWVVNYSINAVVGGSASTTCYPPESFSVQNLGDCPTCSGGTWVQRAFSSTSGTSKACSQVG